MREWVFVLSVMVVVIIALILAAKWRRQRFDDIQSGSYPSGSDRELGGELNGKPDDFSSDELPGGGARTVGYRDPKDIEKMNYEIKVRAEESKPRLSSFRPQPVEQPSLLLDDDIDDLDEERVVPLLLDPSDQHNQSEEQSSGNSVRSSSRNRAETKSNLKSNLKPGSTAHAEEVRALEAIAEGLKEVEPELELRAEPESNPPEDKPVESQTKTLKAKQTKPSRSAEVVAEKAADTSASSGEPGEILIINLMTEPGQPFSGRELYKAVSELGMRHGDMKIFHYCGRHGDEQPQFRMANLLKPGYFDLDAIDQTRTHALCFFFELTADQNNMKIYETMLSVINKVREELGGQLHDENRSVFTIQTSEHCRNRIRDFQRRHLLAKS